MLLNDEFRKSLIKANFVERVMEIMDNKVSNILKDIKNSCIKIVVALLRDEDAKDKIDVCILLRFINKEILSSSSETREFLFHILESNFVHQAKTIIRKQYPSLLPLLDEWKKNRHKQ